VGSIGQAASPLRKSSVSPRCERGLPQNINGQRMKGWKPDPQFYFEGNFSSLKRVEYPAGL
jgi:hypothetical protein